MSCDDVLKLSDLETAKKHDNFHTEVITGKSLTTGANIDHATNAVTGQVQKTLPKAINELGGMGYARVGTFATGATLTTARQTLLWDITDGGDGQEYGWSGVFPPSGKVVPPGSTPNSTGGVGVGAWMSRFDPELRGDWDGFTAELLAQAGIEDDGQPDELGSSKRVDAINAIGARRYVASFKTDQYGSAVENMIAGRVNGVAGAVAHRVGNIYSTGWTTWECVVDGASVIGDFKALNTPNVKDFGAKGDGINDDLASCQAAVNSTESGSIVFDSGEYFFSSSLLFNSLDNPTVEFLRGAKINCDETFTFVLGVRGILHFRDCLNPTVKFAHIDGAMKNSVTATEPFEDGDAGIEYTQCKGLCSTVKPTIKNVMSWGVIHVGCEGTEVIAPTIYNCILQSGVGHAGVKSAKVIDFDIQEVGLYGVEIETRSSNDRSFVGNGTIIHSQKGVAIVNNSYQTTVKSVTAIECKQGFNVSNSAGHVSFQGCTALDCNFGALFDNPKGLFCDLEYKRAPGTTDLPFLRERSYDYILKVENGYGFVLDNDAQRYGGQVGGSVKFINGTTMQIMSMEEVNDPVFGRLKKIQYSEPLDSSYRSQSFKSRSNLLTNSKYIVLYNGSDVTIKNGVASFVDVVFESYGGHNNLHWSNVAANFANEYIRVASGGLSTGTISIESKDCFKVNSIGSGSLSKFQNMATAKYDFSIHKANILNRFTAGSGFITIIKANLTDDWVGSGTPALTIDGSTAIFGGASPWSISFNHSKNTNGTISAKITDTVGGGTVTGASLQVRGFFI